MLRIAPSLLSADLAHLATEVHSLAALGADWLHIDVMDGRFVPSLTFGAPLVAAIRRVSPLPIDVHLMVHEPEALLPAFAAAGATLVTVHLEAVTHVHRALSQLRQLGLQVGVSLNPGTPLSALEPILHLVDVVLLMAVNPGQAGQVFLPQALGRLAGLVQARRDRRLAFLIEVDGGITVSTAAACAAAGADILVVGTALFAAADRGAAIAALRGD